MPSWFSRFTSLLGREVAVARVRTVEDLGIDDPQVRAALADVGLEVNPANLRVLKDWHIRHGLSTDQIIDWYPVVASARAARESVDEGVSAGLLAAFYDVQWWMLTGLSPVAQDALRDTLPEGLDARSWAEQWLLVMPTEQADAYLCAGVGFDEAMTLHEHGEDIPAETLTVMAALLHADDG